MKIGVTILGMLLVFSQSVKAEHGSSYQYDEENCFYNEEHQHIHCTEEEVLDNKRVIYRTNDISYSDRYRDNYRDRNVSGLAVGLAIGIPLLIHNTYKHAYKHNYRHDRRRHHRRHHRSGHRY